MGTRTALLLLTILLPPAHPSGAGAQEPDGDAFLRVTVSAGGEDRIHRLRTRVRHTTVIVLPPGENILDFVVGDAEYWHLTGAANVAFVKPLAPDLGTNIALVCESGRIYSFLVSERTGEVPHLLVRLEAAAGEGASLDGGEGPAFVARSEVAAYREMAAGAAEAAREARAGAEAEIEAFRAAYPTRLAFDYRLDLEAAERPFLVEAMWHDGEFTYLRSRAQESPALYELLDGEPSLVAYDLTADGLYIARHVLGDGWLQIGDERMSWRFVPRERFR
ncbi:MAG: TrbG/VirB9 family P-type conjugative transfer protein [Acidobacteriota bacterium]|nr:TrbG/VirB9 family P-type conjugative transfer protein [Acidobacteriota bacterium]